MHQIENTPTELQRRKHVLQETNAMEDAANLTELAQESNMVLQRLLIKVLLLANLAQAALRQTTSSSTTT
jgi:hypothetical protein